MNELSRPPLRPVCAAIAMLLCVGGAAAQAQGAVSTLKSVTVSDKRDPGMGLQQVDGEQLERTQARDTREALQSVPGVDIGGGGSAISQRIFVRGLEDTQINISVDGAVMGGNMYHHQSRVQLDPFLIKSIEVEKGTPRASAGPGGLGGAVRVVTKDASDFLKPGETLGATLSVGSSSNDGRSSGAVLYGQLGAQVEALLAMNRQETSDYKDGNGDRVATTATSHKPASAKVNWKLAPGQALTLAYNSTEDFGWRFLRPNMVSFGPNSTLLPTTLNRDTTTLGYRYTGDGLVRSAEVKAYDDRNENTRAVAGRNYGELVKGNGVNAKFESRFGAHSVKYGVDYQKLDTSAIRSVRAFNPKFINGATNSAAESSDVTGLYVDDDVILGNQWVLSAGLRYDRYGYTDNHQQTFSSSGFSPSAGIKYLAGDALTLRAGYAETLRGVGTKEVFLLDNGPGPYIYRNDANLRPEKARNVELGLDYTAGGWNFQAEVFHQTITDFVDTYFEDDGARRINSGAVTTRGYELGVSNRWGNTSARLSVAYSKPELSGDALSDGNFGLGSSYGRTWALRVDHLLPAYNLDLGWASRVVESLPYVPSGSEPGVTGTKDGYAVHDLYVNWRPTGKDTLRLSLAVRNLFNTYYYDQATYAYSADWEKKLGFAEPGRDVRVEVRWSF